MVQTVSQISELQERQDTIRSALSDVLTTGWSRQHLRSQIERPAAGSSGVSDTLKSLGWSGILIPEALGGYGGTVGEFCALAEELGRHLAYSNILDTAIAGYCLGKAVQDDFQRQILSGITTGEANIALALQPNSPTANRPALVADVRADGVKPVLTGSSLFVRYAEESDYYLIPGRDSSRELGIYLVKSRQDSVRLTPLEVIDWSPVSQVVFSDAPADQVAEGNLAASLLAEITLLQDLTISSELLGVAEGAHELATEYARNRVAFGRPIGAFQAIKHRLVDLRGDVELSRTLCYAAADSFTIEPAERDFKVGMAAYWCKRRLRGVPEGAVQVFGGIGYTWDHDIHLYLRRAAVLTSWLAESETYREMAMPRLLAELTG